MNQKSVAITVFVMIIMALGVISLFAPEYTEQNGQDTLKKFKSYDEIKDFIETNRELMGSHGNYGFFDTRAVFATTRVADSMAVPETVSSDSTGSADFSTTNVQIAGVDEADIVKNDGKYIYVLSGNKIVIIDAYPAENARVLSEIELDRRPTEMFLNEDRLVVVGEGTRRLLRGPTEPALEVFSPRYRYHGLTTVEIYDVSDREQPVLVREFSVSGSYYDSRMIGDYVYSIVNMPTGYGDDIVLPYITEDGIENEITPTDISYFDYPDYSYNYINIIAVNVQDDDEDYTSETFLASNSQNMFVSLDNIYLTHIKRNYLPTPRVIDNPLPNTMPVVDVAIEVSDVVREATAEIRDNRQITVIHKIGISDGEIEYKSEGSAPGIVLNQFSMDEHEGYFRIATTSANSGRATQTNNVYVLDEDLEIVGSVEDLAPGESIFSARFMGDRAYLVTFKKVDPLFVIDLKDPVNPKVLGKLKIPGFSDYMHPYDENHIIGIGKDAVGAEQGDFAWYQGVKLALFDVSDPEKPREVSKYIIGDRGTQSPALSDHKAFLFDRKKNLLVMPLLVAEIDRERYAGDLPLNAYGDFTWQGAYVFDLDTDKGFQLKGKVTHISEDDDSLLKSGYVYKSQYSVKRSLYIDDTLYTISDAMIKMNGLSDLEEVNSVGLPK
jgi:inhibitor of cysteine peptidase